MMTTEQTPKEAWLTAGGENRLARKGGGNFLGDGSGLRVAWVFDYTDVYVCQNS